MTLYEQWIQFLFDRPETTPEWYWDSNVGDFDASNEKKVMLISQTFLRCGTDLTRYNDTQVANGLKYILSNSVSNTPFILCQKGVAEVLRVEAVLHMKHLYRDCFAKRCSRSLSHLGRFDSRPLNLFCYMLWDVSPLSVSVRKRLELGESSVIQGWWPDSGRSPMWTTKNRVRYDRSRLRYPSDLTDDEWAHVEPMIPPAKRGGNKRRVDVREVMNGIMYILSTGCQWRAVPKDLPPRSTLFDYLDLWSWDGTLDRIHHALYVECREQSEREASPTAAIIDSQSVKSAEKGGPGSTRMAMMRARKSRARSATFS